MDLIDYSNKVQEALHQGNNDEYNTLVDKYGKNKATYKEIMLKVSCLSLILITLLSHC